MKRILLFILIFGLLAGILPASAAETPVFSDVGAGDWYREAVAFAVGRGLFYGTSATTFSPQLTMTRAMFVTVLGRHAGVVGQGLGTGIITASGVNMRSGPGTENSILCVLDKDTRLSVLGMSGEWYNVSSGKYTGYVRGDLMKAYDSVFSDVPYGCWYSPYVQWAYREGVADATGSGAFSPERSITRKEICSMLYNYAALRGVELPADRDGSAFIDDMDISDSFRAAVYAMKAAGVITGYEDGSFRPNNSATRGEVAAMLMRYFCCVDFPSDLVAEEPFDFSRVPASDIAESAAVPLSYFDDACFIGHSIVEGMKCYFGLNSDFYAVGGISASKMLSYDGFELGTSHEDEEGNTVADKGTLEQALSKKSYGKVYIMLGINELGNEERHATAYYSAMSRLVDIVKRSQPDAVIYLISITPVSKDRSKAEGSQFNRENVVIFNQRLKQVSIEQGVHYLDVFTLLADSQGYLPASSCMYDGIHILSKQYADIKYFLRTHTA